MSVNVVYSVTDGKGDSSPITINLPSSTSPADAVAFAQTMWPLVNALITGGNVVGRISFDVSGLTSGNPVGSSDVQEIAKFTFGTAIANVFKTLGLPTFLETKMAAGTKYVNQSDTDVAAFITGMVSGVDTSGAGGSGVIQPSDYRDEDLTGIVEAKEAWGKARK
jgi:hypothetical protein